MHVERVVLEKNFMLILVNVSLRLVHNKSKTVAF